MTRLPCHQVSELGQRDVRREVVLVLCGGKGEEHMELYPAARSCQAAIRSAPSARGETSTGAANRAVAAADYRPPRGGGRPAGPERHAPALGGGDGR